MREDLEDLGITLEELKFMKMTEILAEIDKAIDAATWSSMDAPAAEHGMLAFIGTTPEWRIMAVSFEIESQGFPPGSRGHDGTALRWQPPPIMCRLTREQAKRAYELAEQKLNLVPAS